MNDVADGFTFQRDELLTLKLSHLPADATDAVFDFAELESSGIGNGDIDGCFVVVLEVDFGQHGATDKDCHEHFGVENFLATVVEGNLATEAVDECLTDLVF